MADVTFLTINEDGEIEELYMDEEGYRLMCEYEDEYERKQKERKQELREEEARLMYYFDND